MISLRPPPKNLRSGVRTTYLYSTNKWLNNHDDILTYQRDVCDNCHRVRIHRQDKLCLLQSHVQLHRRCSALKGKRGEGDEALQADPI